MCYRNWLGASSIGALPDGYVQNETAIPAWHAAVRAGRLPIARGVALTAEDRLRREVIEQVMCWGEADLPVIAGRHGMAAEGRLVARASGAFNTGLMFVPGADTWHGFAPRPVRRDRANRGPHRSAGSVRSPWGQATGGTAIANPAGMPWRRADFFMVPTANGQPPEAAQTSQTIRGAWPPQGPKCGKSS